MGLKCSVLGHSFEPADFEREREEQGSEVVTVVREIERCVRCGEQRVVSESTEVTAVVDEADVDLERGDAADRGAGTTTDAPGMETDIGADAAAGPTDDEGAFEARDPAEEDTEILTDDEPGREPGAWPEEPDESWEPDAPRDGDGATAETTATDADDPDDDGPVAPTEETLSGITVPEGTIVCTECEFSVDAESSYRDGDPCPDCGAWLTSERNR
jgi:ribosomal protein S27AE